MTREVQGIPPAPRRVRWRAVAWQRWPLCLLGLLLLVYGGVFTWMLFLAYGGKASDSARLDDGPTLAVPGAVASVEGHTGQLHGAPAESVRFVFQHQGLRREGVCFAPDGTFATGQTVSIELLPREAHIARIVGTRLHLLPPWSRPGAWLLATVLPGALILLVWLVTAAAVRRVLVRGDVSVAEVVDVRRVRFVLPPMVAVRYRFRDHHAQVRGSSHWVPVRSPLGLRLEVLRRRGGGGRMPVVHDRQRPRRSRLTLIDDYDGHAAAGAPTADPIPWQQP